MMLHPLVIAGPSGIGKNFLIKHLVENHPFELVLSTTTRAPRAGEVDQVDMDFVTGEQFAQIEREDGFFVLVENFGARYGYRKDAVKKIYADKKIPVAVVFSSAIDDFYREYPGSYGVYLYPESLELLKQRMRERGDSEEKIIERLESVQRELDFFSTEGDRYIHAVVQVGNNTDYLKAVALVLDHYGM